MKLFLSFCAIICTAGLFCNAFMPEHAEQCALESKTTVEEIKKFKMDKNTKLTQTVKDFGTCILKKEGVLKADGTLNKDTDGGAKIVELCKIVDDGKDIVDKLMVCFAEHNEAVDSKKTP